MQGAITSKSRHLNIGPAINRSQIVTVGSNTLIFAIPPGQLKYGRPIAKSEYALKDIPNQERALQPDNVTQLAAPNNLNGETPDVSNGEPSSLTNGIDPTAELQPDDAEATKDNVTEMNTQATGGETNGKEIGTITVKSVEQHGDLDPGANPSVINLEDDEVDLVPKMETGNEVQQSLEVLNMILQLLPLHLPQNLMMLLYMR